MVRHSPSTLLHSLAGATSTCLLKAPTRGGLPQLRGSFTLETRCVHLPRVDLHRLRSSHLGPCPSSGQSLDWGGGRRSMPRPQRQLGPQPVLWPGLLQAPALPRPLELPAALDALELFLKLQTPRLRLQLCAPLLKHLELRLPPCTAHGDDFSSPGRAAWEQPPSPRAKWLRVKW